MTFLRQFYALPGRRLAVACRLAVILACMLAPVGGWALDLVTPIATNNAAANSTQSMSFPVLGTFPQQTTALKTGFSVQWGLFGGFNGQTGNAMYYLALTFALVGMLLIIINPKNRSPGILVPWFMILLVMVFAPYNSKLLFWPIDNSKGSTSSQTCSQFTGAGSIASQVGSGVVVCGFTPEVVAVHLGSTLAMIVSDIMLSQGIQDIVKTSLVDAAFNSSPIQTPNQGAAAEIAAHNQDPKCGSTPMLPVCVSNPTAAAAGGAALSPATNSDPAKLISPEDLEKNFQMRMQGDPNDPNYPAIILPRTQEEAKTYGYDTPAKFHAYMMALSKYISNNPGAGTPPTVPDASSSMDATPLVTQVMQIANDNYQDMGSIGAYLSLPNDNSQMNTLRAKIYQPKTTYNNTANNAAQLAQTSQQQGGITNWNPVDNFYGVVNGLTSVGMSATNGIYGYFTGASKTVTQQIDDDASHKTDSSGSRTDFLKAFTDNGVGLSTGAVSVSNNSGTPQFTVNNSGSGCFADAEKHFSAAVDKQLGTWQSTGAATTAMQTIKDAMMTCKTLSANQIQDMQQDMTDAGADAGTITMITDYLNTGADGASGAALAQRFVDNWQKNAKLGTPDSNASKAPFSSKLTNDKGFGPGVVDVASQVMAAIGIGAAGVAGHFVGILAATTLMIMQYFIDLMLMFMIMVTPFMFLMGLLVPSNAPGMIALTSLGMLVLTLVPMTIRIIDCLIGIVQQMQRTVVGGGWPGWLWDGIIQFAAAGMYLNVIGLTMFIMFKIGDPSNIRGLTEIERGAKEMATAGRDIAVLAGTALATAGAGALIGAAGGSASGVAGLSSVNRKLMAGKALLSGASKPADGAEGSAKSVPQPEGPTPGSGGGEAPPPLLNGEPLLGPDGSPLGDAAQAAARQQQATGNLAGDPLRMLKNPDVGASFVGAGTEAALQTHPEDANAAWQLAKTTGGEPVPVPGTGLQVRNVGGKPVYEPAGGGTLSGAQLVEAGAAAGGTAAVLGGGAAPGGAATAPGGAPVAGGGAGGAQTISVQVAGGKLDSIGNVAGSNATVTSAAEPLQTTATETGTPANTPTANMNANDAAAIIAGAAGGARATSTIPAGVTREQAVADLKAGKTVHEPDGTFYMKMGDGSVLHAPQGDLDKAKLVGANGVVSTEKLNKKQRQAIGNILQAEDTVAKSNEAESVHFGAFGKAMKGMENQVSFDRAALQTMYDNAKKQNLHRTIKTYKAGHKFKDDDGVEHVLTKEMKVQQFSTRGMLKVAGKGAFKGAVGGLIGAVGGGAGGLGGLPFVKQALGIFGEAANEWSQGHERMNMIGKTQGGNWGAKAFNYGMMNSRMSHGAWMRSRYTQLGAYASGGDPGIMAMNNLAAYSDAKNSARASEASLLENYLARLQNLNSKKDGTFDMSHHRAAQRMDAISKVENMDQQAITIKSAKIRVGNPDKDGNYQTVNLTPRIIQELALSKAHKASQDNVEGLFVSAASYQQKMAKQIGKMKAEDAAYEKANNGQQRVDKITVDRLDLRKSDHSARMTTWGVDDDYHREAEMKNYKGKRLGIEQSVNHKVLMEFSDKAGDLSTLNLNTVFMRGAALKAAKMVAKDITMTYSAKDALADFERDRE